MLTTGQDIAIEVTGDGLVLPSREATSLSLATSELIQNAVEHAFIGRERGRIVVRLQAGPDEHAVIVDDDGIGNTREQPPAKGLGLQIVEALVNDDLKGCFELIGAPAGTRAVIRFPNPAGRGVEM